MNAETAAIIAWLRSPDGELWIDSFHEPALDPMISFREEYEPTHDNDAHWHGAWHPDDRGVKFWRDNYDRMVTWTPDLGPEYTDYPGIKETA